MVLVTCSLVHFHPLSKVGTSDAITRDFLLGCSLIFVALNLVWVILLKIGVFCI